MKEVSMLLIGHLADLAGISTRTIRYYHEIGLLPAPPRRASGYRTYGYRDVVLLLRVRQMIETGSSLEQISAVMAQDHDRDTHVILADVDVCCAEQAEQLAARRRLVAELRGRIGGTPTRDTAAVLAPVARPAGASADGRPADLARYAKTLLDMPPDSRLHDWTGDGTTAARCERRIRDVSGVDSRDERPTDIEQRAERNAMTTVTLIVKKGQRIIGEQRELLAQQLKVAYEAGASIRALAESIDRSYGCVYRLLGETDVTLRPRGGGYRYGQNACDDDYEYDDEDQPG